MVIEEEEAEVEEVEEVIEEVVGVKSEDEQKVKDEEESNFETSL